MPPKFFYSVLERIGQFSEVTAEVNPENCQLSYLKELKDAGVNRISIGVQTFSQKLLKTLGRKHSVSDSIKGIENALTIFNNVSADLIFGIPGQNLKMLEEDLKLLTSFNLTHISTYLLTFYEETPFFKTFKDKELPDEKLEKMYLLVKNFLKSKGFKQYEISNFSKKGFECRHNLSYWKLENYEGLGPSAASFIGDTYRKNISSLKNYIALLKRNEIPAEEIKTFSPKELIEIKLLMGLRLTEGIDLKELGLAETFETKRKKLEWLEEEGFISYNLGKLTLTEKAQFIANKIIGELIVSLLES